MKACPVCGNDRAELLASTNVESGARRRVFHVSCPACPTRYEIPFELLTNLTADAVRAPALKARWRRLMQETASRGEKMTRLY